MKYVLFRIFVTICLVIISHNHVYAVYEFCPREVSNENKFCTLRSMSISKKYWNYYAGYYCYIYTDTSRLKIRYNINAISFYCSTTNTTVVLPVIAGSQVNSTSPIFLDYRDDVSLSYIRRTFKTEDLFQNYVSCCVQADECCEDVMNEENIEPSNEYCPVVWDAWSCFPRTKVNTIATLSCSSQAYQSPDDICTLMSEKTCYYNDTTHVAEWNQQTNYNTCAIAPVYRKRHEFHVIFLYICIACSMPAIIIFLAFEKFRQCTRVILHRNLLIAIVVRCLLTILSKTLVILDALKVPAESKNVMANNSVGCRTLSFFESSSKNCIYACMLVDGYYLHKVIVRAFAREPRLVHMYILIACLTLIPSLAWATVVGVNKRDNCWMVDLNNEQWIVDGFRVVILAINTLLLFDIIRVMISKMKQGSISIQTRATFRATLFLIPLFGIHIIVTAKKIVFNDSCTAEDAYYYTRYSMEALQGICVAIFFCYINSEVHSEFRNWYRKRLISLNNRFGLELGRQSLSKRRTTTATIVQYDDSF